MWKDKTTGAFVENADVLVGQWLEGTVVAVANHFLKKNFQLYTTEERKLLFVDDQLRIGATPDACDETSILECKATKSSNLLKNCYFGPEYYIAQLMVQLMLEDKEDGYLAMLDCNLMTYKISKGTVNPIVIYHVKKSPVLIQIIKEEVARFWDCIYRGVPFRANSKAKKFAQLACMLCQEKVI
jgi:hypothetical protein